MQQAEHFFQGNNTYTRLTSGGVESPDLTGDLKKIGWQDIAQISLEKRGVMGEYLKLTLKPELGLSKRQHFWRMSSPAEPLLRLSSYQPSEREAMLNGIVETLGALSEGAATAEFVKEREFNQQFVALLHFPWLTYALIAINVAVFLALAVLGKGFSRFPAVVLLVWGGYLAYEAQRGQWWRLLTSMFLHSGFMHLLSNMLGLYSLGVTIERVFGRRQLAVIYIGAGLLGSALSLHFSAQQAISVGASGAIFGMAGALIVGVFQHRKQVPAAFGWQNIGGLAYFVFYSLANGFGRTGIDNAAHVGGLLAGCVIALILPTRFDMASYQEKVATRIIGALMFINVATTGLAATVPPAQIDLRSIFASQPLLERGFQNFKEVGATLQQLEQLQKEGKVTECELSERARTSLAPLLQSVLDDFSRAKVHPEDPRGNFLKHSQRLSELLLEAALLDLPCAPGEVKPKSSNPEREVQLKKELELAAKAMENEVKALQQRKR